MPFHLFAIILTLSVLLGSTIFVLIAMRASFNSQFRYLENEIKDRDKTIDKIRDEFTDTLRNSEDPEPKLKRYYFTTEKSLELARLWDQTNDRTKDSEAQALLWKCLEQVVPQAAFPNTTLNTDNPIRFYLEWDENDKDPLKEQK
jgi:hypothetical protein